MRYIGHTHLLYLGGPALAGGMSCCPVTAMLLQCDAKVGPPCEKHREAITTSLLTENNGQDTWKWSYKNTAHLSVSPNPNHPRQISNLVWWCGAPLVLALLIPLLPQGLQGKSN